MHKRNHKTTDQTGEPWFATVERSIGSRDKSSDRLTMPLHVLGLHGMSDMYVLPESVKFVALEALVDVQQVKQSIILTVLDNQPLYSSEN